MYFSRTYQKRKALEKTIRGYFTTLGISRGGERNPFYFPGVMALTLQRTRDDRRKERAMARRTGLNLLSSLDQEISDHPELKSALMLVGHSRMNEDRDGDEVMMCVVHPSQAELLAKVLRTILKRDRRLSGFSIGPVPRGEVSLLLEQMFSQQGERPALSVIYI